MNKSSFTILSSHPPYGSDAPRQCFDLAIAAAVFDRPVNYVFMGAGVLQLLKQHAPEAIEQKNLAAMLSSLEMYGVESLFVEAAAMQEFKLELDQLVLPCKPVNDEEIAEMIGQAVMVFNP